MTQEERLDALIEAFRAEEGAETRWQVPPGTDEKRALLRAYMNVREPMELSADVLAIQDAYLRARAEEKGIVDAFALPTVAEAHGKKAPDGARTEGADETATPVDGRVALWQGDITRLKVDVIVNAANKYMLGCFQPGHHCIDNAIHTYAGVQLRLACDNQMKKIRAKIGEKYLQPTAIPMLTDAYNLPAKKIAHVAGPVVEGDLTDAHKEQLAACYRNTLVLCERNGLKSVAFCCISTGVFHFPKREAAEIAVGTVRAYLEAHDSIERVIFNVFHDDDYGIYEAFL